MERFVRCTAHLSRRTGSTARHLTSRPAPSDMDPAMEELKRNAVILGAWLAAIRIAPYVCHAVQGILSK